MAGFPKWHRRVRNLILEILEIVQILLLILVNRANRVNPAPDLDKGHGEGQALALR